MTRHRLVLLAGALWIMAAWMLAANEPLGIMWYLASCGIAFAEPLTGLVLLLLAIPFGPEMVFRTVNTGASDLLAIRSRLALSVSLYDFIALGLFLCVIAGFLARSNPRSLRHPLVYLSVGFLILAVLSTFCSPDLQRFQKYLSYLYLLKYFELVAIFLVGHHFLSRHPEWLSQISDTLYVTALGLGLLPWIRAVFPATPAFFYTRLSYAGLLLIALCVAYRHFFLQRRSRRAWLAFTAFVLLLLYGLVHNYKRTSYAGLVVAAVIVGTLVKNRRYLQHFALCSLVVILVNPAPLIRTFRQLTNTSEIVSIERAYLQTAPGENPTVIELAALQARGESVRERVVIPDVPASARDVILQLPVYVSISHRLLGWVASVAKFGQHPLLGHGFWSELFTDAPTPHNFYLKVLTETGLIGLSLYLLLLARLGGALLRIVNQPDQNASLVALSGGLLSAFAGFLVESFGANIFYIFQLMMSFWLLAGVVLAFEPPRRGLGEI